MKTMKRLSVLLIVAILAAGCREFSVVETPTPPRPVAIANVPAALPTALPQAIVTPDQLTILADEVDQLLANIYERANRAGSTSTWRAALISPNSDQAPVSSSIRTAGS